MDRLTMQDAGGHASAETTRREVQGILTRVVALLLTVVAICIAMYVIFGPFFGKTGAFLLATLTLVFALVACGPYLAVPSVQQEMSEKELRFFLAERHRHWLFSRSIGILIWVVLGTGYLFFEHNKINPYDDHLWETILARFQEIPPLRIAEYFSCILVLLLTNWLIDVRTLRRRNRQYHYHLHRQLSASALAGRAACPNLLSALPAALPEEVTQVLTDNGAVRVERILSKGHVSPPGFWYDQDEDEWVALLTGAARLEVEGQEEEVALAPGDWTLIPAHQKHRVTWTDPDIVSVWLAVYVKSA